MIGSIQPKLKKWVRELNPYLKLVLKTLLAIPCTVSLLQVITVAMGGIGLILPMTVAGYILPPTEPLYIILLGLGIQVVFAFFAWICVTLFSKDMPQFWALGEFFILILLAAAYAQFFA